jgi:hypothetical protein
VAAAPGGTVWRVVIASGRRIVFAGEPRPGCARNDGSGTLTQPSWRLLRLRRMDVAGLPTHSAKQIAALKTNRFILGVSCRAHTLASSATGCLAILGAMPKSQPAMCVCHVQSMSSPVTWLIASAKTQRQRVRGSLPMSGAYLAVPQLASA